MFRNLIILFFIVSFAPISFAQDATLEQCQRLKDLADSYQERRRQGGSGPQMDQWKDKMREYEQQFRDGGCQKYRRKLQA